MPKKLVIQKFKKVGAGQWQQPRMKNYFLQCCDCGLIHRMNFRVRINKKGIAIVQLQAFRAKTAWH